MDCISLLRQWEIKIILHRHIDRPAWFRQFLSPMNLGYVTLTVRANEGTCCERIFGICPSLETRFSETIRCLSVRVGRTRKTEANTVNKTTQRDWLNLNSFYFNIGSTNPAFFFLQRLEEEQTGRTGAKRAVELTWKKSFQPFHYLKGMDFYGHVCIFGTPLESKNFICWPTCFWV